MIVAAAWVSYAGLAPAVDRQRVSCASGPSGLRIARTWFGLALEPFGIGHLVYLKLTATLVPAWLPFHTCIAAFTGAAFIAAGLAVLSGYLSRTAAWLVMMQIGGFTLLVWLPIVASMHADAFSLDEAAISLVLTAGSWVVAESYGVPAASEGAM